MSTQKDSGKAGCRDRLFSDLRAFGRSWGEHYGYAGACDICSTCGYASASPCAKQSLKDSFGREHRPDCPWCTVDNAIFTVLDREHERKERQHTGLSAELLRCGHFEGDGLMPTQTWKQADEKIAAILQFWARLGFNYARAPVCRYCSGRGSRHVRDSFGESHVPDCDWYQLDQLLRPTTPRPTNPVCPACCQPLERIGTLHNGPVWGHTAFEGPGSCEATV